MTEHPSGCKGHRTYVGGPLDGTVEHMSLVTPSDFPLTWQYPAHRHGLYERDLDGGTEAVYRWQITPHNGSSSPEDR